MVSPASLALRERFRRTASRVKQGEDMSRVAVPGVPIGDGGSGCATVFAGLVVTLCFGAFATWRRRTTKAERQ